MTRRRPSDARTRRGRVAELGGLAAGDGRAGRRAGRRAIDPPARTAAAQLPRRIGHAAPRCASGRGPRATCSPSALPDIFGNPSHHHWFDSVAAAVGAGHRQRAAASRSTRSSGASRTTSKAATTWAIATWLLAASGRRARTALQRWSRAERTRCRLADASAGAAPGARGSLWGWPSSRCSLPLARRSMPCSSTGCRAGTNCTAPSAGSFPLR